MSGLFVRFIFVWIILLLPWQEGYDLVLVILKTWWSGNENKDKKFEWRKHNLHYDFCAAFLTEFRDEAHLNQLRFQLCRVKSPTLIINGERIELWQLKHWAGLSGSSLVRGMSTIFVTELDLGVRCSLIGPLNKSHFQGSSLTALTSKNGICWKSETIPLRQCLWPQLNTRPDYVPHHSDEICTLKKYARGRLPSIFKVSNGSILSHGEIRLEKKYEMQCRWTALQFESTFLGLTGRYNDLYSILWNIHKTIKDRTSLIQCTDLIIKWTLPVDCCRGALIWNVLRKKLERLFDQCEKYGWWARISCANLQLNVFIF